MDIDHKKLESQSKQLGDIWDGRVKADGADKEVQHCLLLLTYHFAELVLSNPEPKEALLKLPENFQDDVRTVAKMIHSYRTKPN
jgi:hypothetical protein